MSEQFAYNDAKDLKDYVAKLGLPEGSTWADVTKHNDANRL